MDDSFNGTEYETKTAFKKVGLRWEFRLTDLYGAEIVKVSGFVTKIDAVVESRIRRKAYRDEMLARRASIKSKRGKKISWGGDFQPPKSKPKTTLPDLERFALFYA